MPTPLPQLDPDLERQLAAGLFNAVWEYLEQPDRSDADEQKMLSAAHASRWHWSQLDAGPVKAVRSEWLLARVYAVLRRGEAAMLHAHRALALCDASGIDGFDRAFAHEALARAAKLVGDAELQAKHLRAARDLAAGISKAEDRGWLEANLADLA